MVERRKEVYGSNIECRKYGNNYTKLEQCKGEVEPDSKNHIRILLKMKNNIFLEYDWMEKYKDRARKLHLQSGHESFEKNIAAYQNKLYEIKIFLREKINKKNVIKEQLQEINCNFAGCFTCG